MFILGIIIGVFIGIVLMCIVQMSKEENVNERNFK